MQSTVCAWGVAILCFVVLMIVTPAIPQSQEYHDFADKRQFFAWKVSFGVGHVFFLGVAAVAFGSGYHHLKPDDARLVWDRLPMTVAFTSLIAIFIIERLMREKAQSTLHLGACLSFNRQEIEPLTGITDKIVHTPYRFCNDLRPYAQCTTPVCSLHCHTVHGYLVASNVYTFCILALGTAKVEEAADKPIYKWTHHFVSWHTLKHLCAATVPVFLTLMLAILKQKGFFFWLFFPPTCSCLEL